MNIARAVLRSMVACAVVASGLALAQSQRAGANAFVPFSQPLRIPPVYTKPNLSITMREACVQVLPGPCTKMWTYDGVFPGPTIRRPSGKPTRVTFTNDLPPAVGSTTVHHHGNHSESQFDGQPDTHLIPPGGKYTYRYDFMERGEPERAAFQWYHDHRMEVTGRNVWMGLAGMFVLDDDFDAALPLPKGKYDVPLMIVDRSFDEHNQLNYKFNSTGAHGDTVLVNGVASPYFEVADRTYRLRLLNASNFREYRFELGNGAEMIEVASESGLLPKPVRRTSITLGPAGRAEVIVNFKGMLGQDVVFTNTNEPVKEDKVPIPTQVMQFRVRQHVSDDDTRMPDELRPLPAFGDPGVTKRVFTLGAVPGAGALHHADDEAPQHFLWTINGRAYDPDYFAADPKLGSTERWVFVNPTAGLHRVHLHDVDWRIVSRRGGVPVLTPGDPDTALDETGLKETFLVQSFETVEVETKFTDHLGTYVFHCHILEHEDNGMMAQFKVVPADGSAPDDHSHAPEHSDAPSAQAPTRVAASAHDVAHPASAPVTPTATVGNARHPRLAARAAASRLHGSATVDTGSQTATAIAMLALGVAAAGASLPRNRPAFAKLAGAVLALELFGLGWDIAVHASTGERMELFENGGHVVVAGGLLLLALAVTLPSFPARAQQWLRRRARW